MLLHPPEATLTLHPSVNVVTRENTHVGIEVELTDDRRIYSEICTDA
jgi:hypothetical protein